MIILINIRIQPVLFLDMLGSSGDNIHKGSDFAPLRKLKICFDMSVGDSACPDDGDPNHIPSPLSDPIFSEPLLSGCLSVYSVYCLSSGDAIRIMLQCMQILHILTGGSFMQADTTQAPFLPMDQPGNRGYEAHHNFSETFEVTQFHCHDYFEFYIHLRGGEYMGVDNRLYPLLPNQLFVLPPFSMHGLSCTREMKNYERAYLNLAPEVLRVLGCGQIDPENLFRQHTAGHVCTYQLSHEDAESFVSCIRQIRDNRSRKDDPYERYGDYALMISLLNIVCRTMRGTDPVEGKAFGSSIIQEILDYINNHYTQPIRMENLARSFGVSVSWLSHEFARFTNRSVYDYVLYRRVMLARQQMLGKASLNDIAYQCGFNDYSNFLRSFSRIVGMSPSQYRKQLRQYSKKEVDEHMQL